jgi:hypothetical protein
MIVITLSAGNRSVTERIPDNETRINIDPAYYRDVQFLLDSRAALERYQDHFIYGYLESLYREGALPPFIAAAPAVEVELKHEP